MLRTQLDDGMGGEDDGRRWDGARSSSRYNGGAVNVLVFVCPVLDQNDEESVDVEKEQIDVF